MYTLHIENKIPEFGAWKAAFDKFEDARAERGVAAYRVTRSVLDPTSVHVDLEFADRRQAEEFVPFLEKVWSTPQSRAVLSWHAEPQVREVVG
ncbi:MAG TPA: hypothetical protein VIW24_19530 [Aldersonia sp.]